MSDRTADQPDYYAILGLDADAAGSISAEDIKAAYRAAAKHAHPDAGGSAAAMEQLNEAHRVLSDPLERREYDHRRLNPEPPTHGEPQPSAEPHGHATTASQPHHPHTGAHDPVAFARLRRRQARRNALQFLRRSAIAALVLNILTRYVLIFVSDTTARVMLKLVGFAPIYCLVLGLIFILSPQIRLDLFDLTQHLRRRGPDPHLSRADSITLLALGLAFVPLAIAWSMLT